MFAPATSSNAAVQAYKVVVVGDGRVGKTSISLRFVRDTFSTEQAQTLGAAYMVQSVILGSSIIKLEIWDTAGQEQYHGIVPLYYRNAKAAIVVYDVTSRASFEQATFWIKSIKESNPNENGTPNRNGVPNGAPNGDGIPIFMILVGNKTDLLTSRCVSVEEGGALAKEFNISFMETSAKTNINVSELFIKVAQNVKDAPVPPKNRDLVDPNSKREILKKNCCG